MPIPICCPYLYWTHALDATVQLFAYPLANGCARTTQIPNYMSNRMAHETGSARNYTPWRAKPLPVHSVWLDAESINFYYDEIESDARGILMNILLRHVWELFEAIVGLLGPQNTGKITGFSAKIWRLWNGAAYFIFPFSWEFGTVRCSRGCLL